MSHSIGIELFFTLLVRKGVIIDHFLRRIKGALPQKKKSNLCQKKYYFKFHLSTPSKVQKLI